MLNLKKLLILLGAISLAFTLSTAEGKCNKSNDDNAKKEMKCESGKCASDKNNTKKVPVKGKCGQGKCG